MNPEDFNKLLEEGKIIDNRREINNTKVRLKEVLIELAKNSESLKSAVGYFYISGLLEIIHSLKDLKEIKILMGYETDKPTKDQLIKAFKEQFNQMEEGENSDQLISLFYRLVNDYQTLKVRVYFGDKGKERLHSKAYLFLRETQENGLLVDKYRAGIIGSSNLTTSGLIGNTELNTIVTEAKDLQYLEKWFDNLWENGTEEFEKLKVSEALLEALKQSKFKEVLENQFNYIEPREFFKILIKYLNADYLFEEFKKSKLLQFQYIDFIRVLNNFNSKNYRGCFLTSSVGLGKSYVAAQVAKYFITNKEKVLLIAPAGLVYDEDQWIRYLKEFDIYDKVKLVSMGLLQKEPERFNFKKYSKNYGLIIVDEVHNYRGEDSYRTRNLKKIIDENGNSRVLFLTATPINTSLDDLINLIKLFYRKGQNPYFDKLVRELIDIVSIFKDKPYEEWSDIEKIKFSEIQEGIEKELFVKSTRDTIKTNKDYIAELKEFAGVDITKLPDPETTEVKYELDSRYSDVVNGIVDFIQSLSVAHLRILDPEKGIRLSSFFKWILYKRFESDISSYYLTLRRLLKKDSLIFKSVKEKNVSYLDEDDEDLDLNFQMDFREKLRGVIDCIKDGKGEEHLKILNELEADISLIQKEVEKLEPFLKEKNKVLFKNDQKINQLNTIINQNKDKKLLIFTEYKDTLRAIKEYFDKILSPEVVRYVDSNTKNKATIIEKFNDSKSKLSILMTTDTLSEGFNISGADIVINFDIPYNPVRIIQRVGRATRLDNPKEVMVINFRPDNSIDKELELVKTLEIRIKDIIRFIGIEYRIWFDTEKELLEQRRTLDRRIYKEVSFEVFEKIRKSVREGNFEKLEMPIGYTKPILIFLQKAIRNYEIKKEELEAIKIPHTKSYTLIEGKKDLTMFYGESDSFNESILLNKETKPNSKVLNLELEFKKELSEYEKEKNIKLQEKKKLEYFNDKLDRSINSVVDYIDKEKYSLLYSNVERLKESLFNARDKCGSTTEKVVTKILQDIKKKVPNEKSFSEWIIELEESFTKKEVQKKLVSKKEPVLAIGFIE